MADANQNFSKVTKAVDAKGMVVILKNNKPRYVVVDFSEYERVKTAIKMRADKISDMGDVLVDENVVVWIIKSILPLFCYLMSINKLIYILIVFN